MNISPRNIACLHFLQGASKLRDHVEGKKRAFHDLFITCSGPHVSLGGFIQSNPQIPVAGRLILGQKSLTSYLRIHVRRTVAEKRRSDLLRWVLDEADAGFNVGLETFDGFFEQLLLIVVGAAEDVDGLLSSVRLSQR
jgi:hypothetical protein